MPSFTDAVQPIDTLKHFRDSYNATRAEVTTLRLNSNDTVSQQFRFFYPALVAVSGDATGEFNDFTWSDASGGANNSKVTIPGTAWPTLPSPKVGEAIKFSMVAGSVPTPVTFRYQAKDQFIFGTNPGQISEMTMNLRYAKSGADSDPAALIRFGLYEGTNAHTAPKRIEILGALDTTDVALTRNIYGIGAAENLLMLYASNNTWADIAIRITPTTITYYSAGSSVTRPVVLANYSDVAFNLAFAFYAESDFSGTTHFIDEISYQVIRN